MRTKTKFDEAIKAHQLSKHYKIPRSKSKRIAVDRLDISVAPNEIFGFLGPNGAGKTTTIKMLLSFVRPSGGAAWIFGVPVELESARAEVGYVPEQPYFPKFLTSLELVRCHGGMHGLSGRDSSRRALECLETVGMSHVSHSPLSQLSKGMTQRIALACALVGNPQVLILDEPSSGLDPVGRKELRELLERLKSEGKTLFLSSHLLSEMEAFCDRVAILSEGKLVACGTPDEIVEVRDQVAVEFETSPSDEAIDEQVQKLGGCISTPERSNAQGQRTALIPSGNVYNIIQLLQQHAAKLCSVTPQRETLEDAFLRLVNGGAR